MQTEGAGSPDPQTGATTTASCPSALSPAQSASMLATTPLLIG